MPMVDIWKVRVLVDQPLVAVPMFMWLVTVPGEVVFVLVVFVMGVPMAMLHRLMCVLVLVVLGEV